MIVWKMTARFSKTKLPKYEVTVG